jgi:NAD+ kinase
MDGQRNLVSCETSPVTVSISRHTLLLAQRPDYSHFAVVRTKLKWSGGDAERHA